MNVRWFGHSAFALSGASSVIIDPFVADRVRDEFGGRFDYPAIVSALADLVLVTHEHIDHNGSEAVAGEPVVVRGGRLEASVNEERAVRRWQTPVGEVMGISSDHGDGEPNTVFAFGLDGVRVCHFGDFGQPELSDWQAQAIGQTDLLFIPVGGTFTIGGKTAAQIAMQLAPKWVIPMHYRTAAIDWEIESADDFLAAFLPAAVVRLETSDFDPEAHLRNGQVTVLLPALP